MYLKIIILFFFLLINISSSYSDDKVSFLNINYIIKNSIAGKSIIKKIDLIKDEGVKKLKEREKSIKAKDEKIKAQSNILTKDEINLKIKELKEEVKKFNIDRENLINQYESKKKKDLDNLLTKISPILKNYMKENSIGIILNQKNIFIANSEYNITQNILKLVDESIK